ncbi:MULTISPECIES: hypothetical protein [Chitinophagaceae]
MSKNIFIIILMFSVMMANAQSSPLSAEQKARMDSLSKIFDNNRKLEVLNVSLKKIFKKAGVFYATVEWKNLGKEPIASFSGTLKIHGGEIGDDMIWVNTRPLPNPLQPDIPHLQDYELPHAYKIFPKVPKADEAFLLFTADTLKTANNNLIRIKGMGDKPKNELFTLIERDKDYNIYKEVSERKQKYLQNEAKLKLLEGKFLKIDLIDNQPYIFCEFKNKSGQALNVYGTRISIYANNNKNNGWDCSNGSDPDIYLQPNESITIQCRMRNIACDKMQFPVTDPSLYHLTITAVCDMIKLDEMTYRTIEFTEKDEETLNLLNEKYK